MASLSETVGQDVPTFDEVRDKIEARYAKAKGMSELTETVGREPHARDRAGHAEHRGPGPPRPRSGRSSGIAPRRAADSRSGRRGPPRPRRPAARAEPSPRSQARSGQRSPTASRGDRPPLERSGASRSGQDDEVVAVDDLVRRCRRQVARRWPATAERDGVDAHQALGERPRRRGRRPRPRRSASNVAADVDDAGRQQRRAALAAGPGGPRRRPTTVPVEPDGEGDPQLAGRQPRGRGAAPPCRRRPRRRPRRRSTSVAVGGGDHRAHARPGGDLGGGELGRHAAAAPGRCRRRPATRLELVVDLDDLLDERRRRRRGGGRR